MTPYYRQQVRKLDSKCDPSSEEGQACALMLAALKHGCRQVRPLAAITGVPLKKTFAVARNLRANGVWNADGKTRCDWMDAETGGISFWLDVNVALGRMNRVAVGKSSSQSEGV